jgi:hypothetical protein
MELKDLIKDLLVECKEIEEMIRLRVESSDLPDDYREDPFTLDVNFEDSELNQMHSYDLGRMEAFQEIVGVLKKIKK